LGEIMLYPINLNLNGKKCLIVGGGEVATRKISSLIETGAKITIISPVVTEKINELVKEKKIIWIDDIYKSGMAKGYFLTIVATNNDEVNKFAIKDAKNFGALINAPANPELSDFTVPAAIKRGDLTVAVSTDGLSPAFSRMIKEEISEFLPKNTEEWLKIIKRVRNKGKERLKSSKDREKFWRKALNKRIFELLKEGRLKEAEAELEHGFSCDGVKP